MTAKRHEFYFGYWSIWDDNLEDVVQALFSTPARELISESLNFYLLKGRNELRKKTADTGLWTITELVIKGNKEIAVNVLVEHRE